MATGDSCIYLWTWSLDRLYPAPTEWIGFIKSRIVVATKSWEDDPDVSGYCMWWEWSLCCDPLRFIPCFLIWFLLSVKVKLFANIEMGRIPHCGIRSISMLAFLYVKINPTHKFQTCLRSLDKVRWGVWLGRHIVLALKAFHLNVKINPRGENHT